MNFFRRPSGSQATVELRKPETKENLARDCREFYEKRVELARSALEKWEGFDSSISTSSGTPSPRSLASRSSGTARSALSSESDESEGSSRRRIPVEKTARKSAGSGSNTLPGRKKLMENRRRKVSVDNLADESSEDELELDVGPQSLFDPRGLPEKIQRLRRDILSLIDLDNELFKNLLTINDALEEIKEQRLKSPESKAALVEPVNFRLGTYNDKHRYSGSSSEESEEAGVPGPFASLPDQTYVMQKRQLLSQQNPGDKLRNGLKFMLRSRSFLTKPKAIASSSKRAAVKTKIPVKIKSREPGPIVMHPPQQPSSLPFIQENLTLHSSSSRNSSASRPGETERSAYSRPFFHLPHQPRNRQLWQKVFDEMDSPNHQKQNSIDSGIHNGSDTNTASDKECW